jgi:hypothetical protein
MNTTLIYIPFDSEFHSEQNCILTFQRKSIKRLRKVRKTIIQRLSIDQTDLKKGKAGITRTQIKDCLKMIIDRLKHNLYKGFLPPNYSALTCLNCQIILNGTPYCLFHRIEDMNK